MTYCYYCMWSEWDLHDTVVGCQMGNPQEIHIVDYQPVEQPCPDFQKEEE